MNNQRTTASKMTWRAVLGSLVLLLVVDAVVADNLALLSSTLKTIQQASCNEEQMTLRCPIGTAITVAVARYGRANIDRQGNCTTTDPLVAENQLNSTCIWPNSIQHSLLQTVVEVCQKKRQCTFNTSPKKGDPCPDLPKYVEVVYKCRPYEFRSKVACENDSINLFCHPGYRIAIYDAAFGRTEYESLQCPQPNGVKDQTCLASFATEKVVALCHGRRNCLITANSATFNGDPCKPESRTYLKVVYTCVWHTVLGEQFLKSFMEPDEANLPNGTDEGFDRADFRVEFSPSPNLESPQFRGQLDNVTRSSAKSTPEMSTPPRIRTNSDVPAGVQYRNPNAVGKDERKAGKRHHQHRLLQSSRLPAPDLMLDAPGNASGLNCTVIQAKSEETRGIFGNFLSDWIRAYGFLSHNQEKFYLYIIVSVSTGLLLILALVIGRLLLSRHKAKRDAKFHTNSEPLPNGFTDDISEIDADIDLTTPVPVPMQDTRLPETHLAERLHAERYYSDARIPLSPGSVHSGHSIIVGGHIPGMRVDLGNHMVGTDSLHTILRPESTRAGLSAGKTSYYYG